MRSQLEENVENDRVDESDSDQMGSEHLETGEQNETARFDFCPEQDVLM